MGAGGCSPTPMLSIGSIQAPSKKFWHGEEEEGEERKKKRKREERRKKKKMSPPLVQARLHPCLQALMEELIVSIARLDMSDLLPFLKLLNPQEWC